MMNVEHPAAWISSFMLFGIILVCGVAMVGIIFMVTHKLKSAAKASELAYLREEVAQLREEVERLKMTLSASRSTDIKKLSN